MGAGDDEGGGGRVRTTLVRLLACVVGAAVLGLPLSVGWAVTHTAVEEKVGTTPTRLTLSTQGTSEVRLGIAGTVYVPRAVGPLGIVATVEGPGDPGAGDGDLANYVRPEMLQLYTGIFHDPGPAIDQYVGLVRDELRSQLVRAFLVVSLGGGLLLFGVVHLVPLRRPSGARDRLRVGLAAALVLTATTSVAAAQVLGSDGHRGPTAGIYPLDVLDGTLAAGATTDSPVIRAVTGGALAKARVLVERQERAAERYRATAVDGLEAQQVLMSPPREGETAILMQSDMHCNTTMIRVQRAVVDLLREQHGEDVPALMAVAGDLTTNGTAAEGPCIRSERDIMGDGPVVAVTGNHESDVSDQQMADAGITVLDGATEEVAGVRVLGDGDPSRSELFGATRLRGDETQADVGARLRAVAADADPEDRPDLVLVHEAYAAEAFLGVDDVNDLISPDDGSGAGVPRPTPEPLAGGADGIDDVPASAVFYGHWHRSVQPRTIWNSDGTWTLLMELDTSGGAIDTPTINNFSTPWSKPQQSASFPVVFLDEETRLVTGYQVYRFATDGTAVVEPRVEVGAPATLPDPDSPAVPLAEPGDPAATPARGTPAADEQPTTLPSCSPRPGSAPTTASPCSSSAGSSAATPSTSTSPAPSTTARPRR
jgi:hypothetical protein